MQKERVCIAIPVYKKISDPREVASVKQGLLIFHNYTVVFICPDSFEESWLDEYKNLHPKITFQKFSDESFKSVKAYSSLLLRQDFYKKFSNFEFMLIYQPDAYVFRDELKYWCDKGFDYIGAPWFKNFDEHDKEKEFMPNAGNGGFSLRNISKTNEIMQKKLGFLEILKLKKILREARCKPHIKIIFGIGFFLKFFTRKNTFSKMINYTLNHASCTNEDYFFASIYPQMFPEFKVAKAEEAVAFSFECQPKNLFKMNGEKLPFGCHAWHKYSPDFWSNFIKY